MPTWQRSFRRPQLQLSIAIKGLYCKCFTATSFSLLTLSGSNNSVGYFQGQGTIVVDGVSSQVKFTVAAQDGDLITPAQTDTIAIKIFNLADNPATAAPLYQVTGSLSHGSGVKIQ